MSALILQGTHKTPEILLDPELQRFAIRGRSIPQEADDFYQPVIDWFRDYTALKFESFELDVKIDFFNIASSKKLLYLLHHFNSLVTKEISIAINWMYDDGDLEMFELGQDFAFMVQQLKFNFVETKVMEEAAIY